MNGVLSFQTGASTLNEVEGIEKPSGGKVNRGRDATVVVAVESVGR